MPRQVRSQGRVASDGDGLVRAACAPLCSTVWSGSPLEAAADAEGTRGSCEPRASRGPLGVASPCAARLFLPWLRLPSSRCWPSSIPGPASTGRPFRRAVTPPALLSVVILSLTHLSTLLSPAGGEEKEAAEEELGRMTHGGGGRSSPHLHPTRCGGGVNSCGLSPLYVRQSRLRRGGRPEPPARRQGRRGGPRGGGGALERPMGAAHSDSD